MCTQLPAFHALTGCDRVTAFFGYGKNKAWKAMKTLHLNNGPHLKTMATDL